MKKYLLLTLLVTINGLIIAQNKQKIMTNNPLLQPFSTPHNTPPYDKIKVEHFMPAIAEGMVSGRKDIEAIIKNPAKPTFDNTIVALERAGELLSKVTPILFHLNGAETTDAIQQVVKEASPLLTEYGNDISLNQKLFARVKAVWEQRSSLKLDKESEMLLEKTYKSFARNGANLNDTDKEKMRSINKELSQLSIEFSEHNLAETNEYALLITNEADLAGLPDFAKEAAKALSVYLTKIPHKQLPELMSCLMLKNNDHAQLLLAGIHGYYQEMSQAAAPALKNAM